MNTRDITNINLRLGLEENFYHSFKRGYELYIEAKNNQNAWLLKESIIWIHHGIEIGLKLLLIQTNEYLIFDNINDAINSFDRIIKTNPNATIMDVFEEPNSIHSVGFDTSMNRAAIMLGLEELRKGNNLGQKIYELAKYRNQIVHFSINLDTEKIVTLIEHIVKKFLSLLEKNIKDEEFIKEYLPSICRTDLPMRSPFETSTKKVRTKVLNLMKLFNEQKVSGELFNLNKEIGLPKFENESFNIIDEWTCRVIVEAETLSKKKWFVFIQTGINSYNVSQKLYYDIILYKSACKDCEIWLVNCVGDALLETIGKALGQMGILISNEANIKDLEKQIN